MQPTAARHRAEVLLHHPPLIGAMGDVRAAVLQLREEARAALAQADDRLRQAAEERRAALARLQACQRALVGDGQVVDRASGALVQVLPRRGARVAELVRLLAHHGVRPTGRPSQTLSNAVRVEVEAGRLVRLDRNRFAAQVEADAVEVKSAEVSAADNH